MYTNDKHIIKREVFEFEIEDKSDVSIVQKSLTEILTNKVPSLIDEIYSKYSNNEIIELNKIEIDLEEINLENIEEQILHKFSTEFEKIIVDKIKVVPDSTEVEIGRLAGSNLELISQFLLTGRLPWWAVITDELNIDEIFIELLRTEPDKLINAIINLRKHKTVTRRLLKQFHQNSLTELYVYLKKTIHDVSQVELDDVERILEIIKTNLPNSFNLSEIKMILTLYVLSIPSIAQSTFYQNIIKILADYYDISEEQCFTAILSSVIAEHKAIFGSPRYIKVLSEILFLSDEEKVQNELVLAVREKKKGKTKFNELFQTYRIQKASGEKNADSKRSEMGKIMLSGKAEGKSKARLYELNKESRKAKEVIDNDAINDLNIADREKERVLTEGLDYEEEEEAVIPDLKLMEDSEEITDEEIYIENAGLVIIAPFLSRLFKKLNIIDEGEFGSEVQKEKGVHILQYLVNGKSHNPEYLLQLNKLLCGLKIDDVISIEYELRDLEKTECENLLESIIKNWNSLKNTSIESFRNSFLARKGVLRFSENGWTLNVERKSYDILLNSLPWSISIIKLKWMKKALFVEW